MLGKLSIDYIPTCVRQEIAAKVGVDFDVVDKIISELQEIEFRQKQEIRRQELRESALQKLTPQEREALSLD